MTTLLDEPGRWPEVDAERAGELIRDLPEQLKTGEALGRDAAAGVRLRGFENVAVLGMGGSGIVGRVLAAYAQSRLETPVMVIREFDAPAWLGPKTLAVTVSYSGNTLETLTATREAMARAAGVLAVTSGGKLAEMAQAGGHTWIKVPPGQPPRCALGFMAGGVFSFLRGAAGLKLDGLTETIVHLGRCWRRWGFDVPEADNDAKKAAAALAGAAGAAVYGAGPEAAVAAERCRTQLAENAKYYASGRSFPELCHNELVAFEVPNDVARGLHVLAFRPARESADEKKQVDAALELIAPVVSGISRVRATAEGLAGIFELIYFGDLVSYYLALLRGVDPTPVESIRVLKARLAA